MSVTTARPSGKAWTVVGAGFVGGRAPRNSAAAGVEVDGPVAGVAESPREQAIKSAPDTTTTERRSAEERGCHQRVSAIEGRPEMVPVSSGAPVQLGGRIRRASDVGRFATAGACGHLAASLLMPTDLTRIRDVTPAPRCLSASLARLRWARSVGDARIAMDDSQPRPVSLWTARGGGACAAARRHDR